MKKELLWSVTVDSNSLQAAGAWPRRGRPADQVFMQGQTGIHLEDYADVKVVGIGDPAEQTRVALNNIDRLMRKAGGSLQDVVKIIVYVTDRAFRPAVYGEINKAFTGVQPVSTGIVVAGLALPELLMEIEHSGDHRRRMTLGDPSITTGPSNRPANPSPDSALIQRSRRAA